MEGFKVKFDLVDCISQLKDIDKQMFIKELFDNLDETNQKDLLIEMIDSLSGINATNVIEDAFDNLNEQGQASVQSYINDIMGE